jgi:hypothetical protein
MEYSEATKASSWAAGIITDRSRVERIRLNANAARQLSIAVTAA